jgi:hypothetical protein
MMSKSMWLISSVPLLAMSFSVSSPAGAEPSFGPPSEPACGGDKDKTDKDKDKTDKDKSLAPLSVTGSCGGDKDKTDKDDKDKALAPS